MVSLVQVGFLSGAPGPGELILIFLAVLLLFGPRKLPAFALLLGHLMHQLRRASNEFRDQLMSVDEDDDGVARPITGVEPDEAGDEAAGPVGWEGDTEGKEPPRAG